MKELLCALEISATMAAAQNDCEPVKGMLQARLENGRWAGDVHLVAAETDVLTGAFRPIQPPQSSNADGIGVETGLKFQFDFGDQGSISVEIPYGITLRPAPGPAGHAEYRGVGKIIDATGRFDKRAGTLLMEGMYILWFDPSDRSNVWGRWNAQLTMRLCKAN
jgi:hypothetical protein